MKKLLLLSVFILIFVSACKEDPSSVPVENKLPETGLFLYPDSSISQQPSRLKVSWWGDDPDGVVLGFYFKWEGIDTKWNFTTSNDSTFSLPIGTVDTNYTFYVAAVDNEGNGKYDQDVFRNGISFGPEPFIDSDNNGKYSSGETYFDIGNIDPTPAKLSFPIKNTAPVIEWDELTQLPDTSFPVMTIRWNADDLDGVESITSINIALNDTTDFVSLNGSVRLVTLRVDNLNSANPQMEILLNGNEQNVFSEKLPNLRLNDFNKIYIQAADISGAKSSFTELPDTSKSWFVKKPLGNLLVVDDFNEASPSANAAADNFYKTQFTNLTNGKYDKLDLANNPLPFSNVTLPQTLKLFDYIFWYSTKTPSLDLLNLVTNPFVESGGKIAFSMTFEDPTSTFEYDLASIQGFLPVDSLSKKVPFLFSGQAVPVVSGYPQLLTSSTISSVRNIYPNSLTELVYNIQSPQINGPIGFRNQNLFFVGLPLHQANGSGNVNLLLEKIFIEHFGYTP